MAELHDIQRDFAAFIRTGDAGGLVDRIVAGELAPEARLAIYRNTALSVLTGALRLTFPAVDRLVGAAFFDAAACGFAAAHPPRKAWLDDYGAEFPAFLAALPAAATLAYLADVARFEWTLNMAAHAPDQPALDLAALARVLETDHGVARLRPHPSVSLLALDHPADAIADAVMAGDAAAMAAIDPVSGPVLLVVHRGPDGVAAERLSPPAFAFLRRLFAGEDLGSLLADGPRDTVEVLARQFMAGRLAGFAIAHDGLEET